VHGVDSDDVDGGFTTTNAGDERFTVRKRKERKITAILRADGSRRARRRPLYTHMVPIVGARATIAFV